MKRSSSVQFRESAGRAAVTFRADRVLHSRSTEMQEGMERASEPDGISPDEPSVVFPPPPLVARVIVAPVPPVPPASLAGFVAARRRRTTDGSSTGSLDRDGSYGAADLMAYADWRRSWERTWELGPLANSGRCIESSASSTTSPVWRRCSGRSIADPEAARIEPVRAPRPARRARRRAGAIAGEPDEGTAIVDQTPRQRSTVGFSRTWSTPAEPQLLAANSDDRRHRRSDRRVGRGRQGDGCPDASPMWSRPTCGAMSWWSRTAAVNRSSSKGQPPDRSRGSRRRRCGGRSGRSHRSWSGRPCSPVFPTHSVSRVRRTR